MTDVPNIINNIVVVGANYRSSTLTLRDRLAIEDENISVFADRLRDRGIIQAIILSTCDRVEIQAVHDNPETASRALMEKLAEYAGVSQSELGDQVYVHTGIDGLRQMVRVAASLDSQVIGEPQVLGQVKASHRLSQNLGMVGRDLENILQFVYGSAKRVRHETRIGEFPVSIAAAACQLARNVHGDLRNCRVLLLGDGDMGELVARYLMNAGAGHLTTIHPDSRRSESLSLCLDCHSVDWNRLSQTLNKSEILISALGRREPVLTADMMAAMVKQRHHKLTFAIDLAFPGDIEPAVNRIDEVFLYSATDLEHVAMEGLTLRSVEAAKASQIIENDMRAFINTQSGRSAVPVISKLRDHVSSLRQQALDQAGGDAEKATHLLMSRLLHHPTEALRLAAADADKAGLDDMEQTLERLFPLNYQHSDAATGGEE